VRSKKCLDLAGLANNDGAGAQQYQCHDGENQQWIIADGGTGSLRIIARHSGKVLDVAGEETADGTHVNQWGWQGKPHQEFTIVPVVAAADTAKAAGGKAGKDGAAGAGGKGKKKQKS